MWLTSSSLAPACTVAVRSACSCATTALSPLVLRTTSTEDGLRPQPIFVPPPRTTTDVRCFEADARTAATSSADAGWINSRGATPSMSGGPEGPPLRSPTSCMSKPLREPRLFERMRVVRPGNLAAEPRCRKHFARIAKSFRIECASDGQHHVQIVVREHLRHVFGFVGTNAVLTGQRSACIDAVLQDLRAHLRGEVRLTRNLLVVAD